MGFDNKTMIKKAIIGIGAVLFIVLCIVFAVQYAEDEKLKRESDEKFRIRKEKKIMFMNTLNGDYLAKYSKEILKPHFDKIDSIKIWPTSPDIEWLIFDYSKNEYYVVFRASGDVVSGVSHYSEGSFFEFNFVDTLYESKIDEKEVRLQKLQIYDNNKDRIYPIETDFSELKRKEEAKAREEARKKQQKNGNSFYVDGIHIKFKKYEGNSFVFETSNILNAEQVVKAIKQIGNGNMVQFYKGDNHYADYVYSTQCIIYKNTGTIYKVINGNPVKI